MLSVRASVDIEVRLSISKNASWKEEQARL
jgi:hypothetical protein